MCQRLREKGFNPHRENVQLNDLKKFLSEKLHNNTPVAIWVRSRKNDFFYIHVIVVVGCDVAEGSYYVINPRRGVLHSHDGELPTGNKVYWKSVFFAIARNFSWCSTIPVVYL
jgi:hypothetical protein